MDLQNQIKTGQSSDFGKQIKLFLIEAVALVILIVIGFLGANYLNIIKLDSAYPILSFLPHEPRIVKTATKPPPTTTAKPTPNSYVTIRPVKEEIVATPTGFAQDRNNAKNLLITDIKDEVNTKYIPTNLSDIPLQTSMNSFSVGWTENNTHEDFQASVNFVDKSNTLESCSVRVQTTNSIKNFSDSAAESAVEKYFTSSDKRTWSCSGTETVICQTTFDSQDKKKGFRVIAGDSLIIISCSIPKDSPTYSQGCFNEQAVLPK